MQIDHFLTEDDHRNLASYHAKCAEVKAFALACLRGTQTGLGLFGSGGIGKSFSIFQLMEERGMIRITSDQTVRDEDVEDDEDREVPGFDSYVQHQGRITAKGLVLEMRRFPNSVHLIEDAETMWRDSTCSGVLRMALHSQDKGIHPVRFITWKTSVEVIDFAFRGSLIIVGNSLPPNNEEFEAVKTRIPFLNFPVPNAEIVSKMKHICEQGFDGIPGYHLTKEDCYSVLDFLLAETEENNILHKAIAAAQGKIADNKKMNFRVLNSGFKLFALSRMEKGINWQEMLSSQLIEEVRGKGKRETRINNEKKAAIDLKVENFVSAHEMYVEFYRRIGKACPEAELPRDSVEYKKWHQKARTDLSRKKKAAK